jgi:hypothetical protein
MSARVRVDRDADGAPVAIKVVAADDPDGAVLAHEAAVLAELRHPGVVDLVELRPGADGPELVTRWVGTRSLADAAPLPIVEAVAVVAALAATVADLHGRGAVHRCIEASHVLLDAGGRPILCSFGRATVGGGGGDGRPSDDVAALGELLGGLAEPPDDAEVVPVRRFGRRRSNHLHRAALNLADHARADDPTVRPSAAALGRALAELAPEAALPRTDVPASSEPPPYPSDPSSSDDSTTPLDHALERLRATSTSVDRTRPARWPWVAGSAGAVLVLVGALVVLASPAPNDGRPTAEPPAEPTSTGGTGRRPTTTTAITRAAPDTPAATDDAPNVDIDGSRFSVGAPGDEALVAPWRCDGRPRPLVLRPSTGDLFIFDTPATSGVDAVASSFATVTGARSLVPVDRDDPCPQPAVLRAAGEVVPVELPPPS